YIQLFDFDLAHVPSEKHKAPDGLSQHKPSPLDSNDEDAEAYLNAFIGSSTTLTCTSTALLSNNFSCFTMLQGVTANSIVFPIEFFTLWLRMQSPFSPELWNEILTFLRNGTLPHHCDNPRNLKTFTKHAKQFIFHDNWLWKMSSAGRIPCLVITDLAHQQNLIAEAHNEAGHRGHDATYKHLTDCFYWPNMFNEVAFFVVSCIICQLWSASRPKVPFSSMWNSTILRHFDLDTNHM
ncbi:hypothetical protein L208DRAFT_1105799, partial [Tricholoma matsutake]